MHQSMIQLQRSHLKSWKGMIDSLTAVKEALYNEKIQSDEDNLRFPLRLEEKIATLELSVSGS